MQISLQVQKEHFYSIINNPDQFRLFEIITNQTKIFKTMKTNYLILLIVTTVLFYQCSIFEQDIDGELSTILYLSEQQEGANFVYADTEVIDAASDKDIKDNLNKIKDWSVSEVSYKIWGFGGPPSTTAAGSIGFSPMSATTAALSATQTSINLSTVSNNDVKYKVNLSEQQLNTIAGYMKKDQAMKVYTFGLLSDAPTSFQVEIIVKVKVKAKVL
jgi:hypothetical protein